MQSGEIHRFALSPPLGVPLTPERKLSPIVRIEGVKSRHLLPEQFWQTCRMWIFLP